MRRSVGARGVLANLGEVAVFVRELRQQIDNMGEAKRPHEVAQHTDGIALLWRAHGHQVDLASFAIIATHKGMYTILQYYDVVCITSRRIAAVSGDLTGRRLGSSSGYPTLRVRREGVTPWRPL